MSGHPRRIGFFGKSEHDDVGATGLPGTRRIRGEDPLSPSFGVAQEDLDIAPSPPSGLVALHPAAVAAAQELKAAHDARVAAGLPGYNPDAEATEPPRTIMVDRTSSRDSTSSTSSNISQAFSSIIRRTFSKE